MLQEDDSVSQMKQSYDKFFEQNHAKLAQFNVLRANDKLEDSLLVNHLKKDQLYIQDVQDRQVCPVFFLSGCSSLANTFSTKNGFYQPQNHVLQKLFQYDCQFAQGISWVGTTKYLDYVNFKIIKEWIMNESANNDYDYNLIRIIQSSLQSYMEKKKVKQNETEMYYIFGCNFVNYGIIPSIQ
ncbi:UNKNOWN [Stylonychia lemnae]|uniref:Uncharacterized protein n=1 Tax=Stylonychia lemnae TaxID=5949 RepID=A0A078ARD9_STYLE|nr:UNKNOWN [Stylonychia lemnae]|eukprot:CDW83787.1 UNKNOWN [Stylonychia lemnae]